MRQNTAFRLTLDNEGQIMSLSNKTLYTNTNYMLLT